MACEEKITLARDGHTTPFFHSNVVNAAVLDFENDVYLLEQAEFDTTTLLGCYFDSGASAFKMIVLDESAPLADLSASDYEKYLGLMFAPDNSETGFLNENDTESPRMLAWIDAPRMDQTDKRAIKVEWDAESFQASDFKLVRA